MLTAAPTWQSEVWHPILMRMSIEKPFLSSHHPHHLDVSYMLRQEGKFVFTFHKLHKSWKYGKAPPSFEFCKYTEYSDLYMVTTFSGYIKRTYQRRAEKRHSKLLLSFIQPYAEVSSSTVSKWIKKAIKFAEIDVLILKGPLSKSSVFF